MELKIDRNDEKEVNFNNEHLSLDPGIKDEEGQNGKQETEGYREIEFEKAMGQW